MPTVSHRPPGLPPALLLDPPAEDVPPEPGLATPVRVELAAGGHQVVVEANCDLDTVAGKALELWQATDSRHVAGAAGAVGFAATDPTYSGLLPPEAELPTRLIPEEGDDRGNRSPTQPRA